MVFSWRKSAVHSVKRSENQHWRNGKTVDYAQGGILLNAALFDEMLFEQVAPGFARSPVINLIDGEFIADRELDSCKTQRGNQKLFEFAAQRFIKAYI